MATNEIKMMMLVNLKAYTTPQLLSTTSHHYSPLQMFINKSRYCPSNKRQIITCSSSKVPRFGIANPMASKEIMPLSAAQQPYTTTPFRSTIADHQSFDPSCDHLLVAVENSIKHAAHMFDTALALECKYTFYYGSNNQDWIDEYENKAKKVINDPCIKDIKVHLEIRCIRELRPREKREEARVLSELINIQTPHFAFVRTNPHADSLRHYFESASDGRFVLTKNLKKVLLNHEGRKILEVLEEFQQWKDKMRNDGFEDSFIDYYKGIKITRYHD